MIQRKQTLFLFQLVFFGIALLFIPSAWVKSGEIETPIFLTPINSGGFSSSIGHQAAIVLNFVGLILAFVTIFLYKQRSMQVKLCNILMLLWIVLTSMILFCPFVELNTRSINYFNAIIGAFAFLAAFLAKRFIKKDIELLKSADRIR